MNPSDWPRRNIAVVSPHLDDGVFSLGGSIAALTKSGRNVRIVTPFAGDPESTALGTEWDRRCGFSTAGEAASARREEDLSACSQLGAEPIWLPFDTTSPDANVRNELIAALRGADLVLIPGFPCRHPDHIRASAIILADPALTRVGLYVEQPYATWRLLARRREVGRRAANFTSLLFGLRAASEIQAPNLPTNFTSLVPRPLRWGALWGGRAARAAKYRSLYAYRSQLRVFGRRMLVGLALYEWRWGGEGIGWFSEENEVVPRRAG